MSIRSQIEALKGIENSLLVSKFGANIHDVDLTDTVQTGVIEPLMKARELGVPYAVVLRGIAQFKPALRQVITTYDIETEDNDQEQELKNIYAFLKGDATSIKAKNAYEPLLSKVGKSK